MLPTSLDLSTKKLMGTISFKPKHILIELPLSLLQSIDVMWYLKMAVWMSNMTKAKKIWFYWLKNTGESILYRRKHLMRPSNTDS